MPIDVIMRDVDPFQRCNDACGRGAGNTMLTSMAQLLRSRTRAGGMASRDGGEEFPRVLPKATLASTRGRAEQLRHAVKPLSVPYASRVLGQITLARGVARFPQSGSSAPALLNAAVRALDAAKPGGRDRAAGAPAI